MTPLAGRWLPELLQASNQDRSRYLEDVMDFQEREARQLRPLVVVVTSRTVVTDRVRVPQGTTVVKLAPFNHHDIADWLRRWRRVNADAIATGTVGDLTMSAARRQPELAEQPLLLLMLALYAADRELPPLDEDMGTAELYRRLLVGFARREADKDLGIGHDPLPDELDQRVQDHLDRLAVAALGMFNRGRQDVSEEELGKDLEALEPQLVERPLNAQAGQRIIGEFFFVHAPEARTNARGEAGRQAQRAYEFLHATFGEYLVARRIMDELLETAATASTSRRGRSEAHDDMLFALLSHQVLAARRSMLDFASEIFVQLSSEARFQVMEAVELLLSNHRNRHDSKRYGTYRPVPPDQIRQLACYSANLVTLRTAMEPEGSAVPLAKLVGASENTLNLWRSMVRLWESGLDSDSMMAMVTTIVRTDNNAVLDMRKPHSDSSRGRVGGSYEITLSQLVDDRELERRLRYGAAITDGYMYYDADDETSWTDMMSSWLIAASGSRLTYPPTGFMLTSPPAGAEESDISSVAQLVLKFLESRRYTFERSDDLFQLASSLIGHLSNQKLALAKLVLANPRLRNKIPELGDLEVYGYYNGLVRRSKQPTDPRQIDFDQLSDEAIVAIQSILAGERRSD